MKRDLHKILSHIKNTCMRKSLPQRFFLKAMISESIPYLTCERNTNQGHDGGEAALLTLKHIQIHWNYLNKYHQYTMS